MLFNRISVLLLFCISSWAQMPGPEGVIVSGEVKSDAVAMFSNYMIELRGQRDDSLVARSLIAGDGSFQLPGVAPGSYVVRVLTERQELVLEEIRRVDPIPGSLQLHLPTVTKNLQPSGLVSIHELAHPIPKKAMRAFEDSVKLMKDPSLAIPKLEEAVRLAPQFRNAHVNLGSMYGRLHRYPEAIEEFRKAIEIGPDDAKTEVNLMMAQVSLHQFADAELSGRKAVSIEPRNTRAQFMLGYALAMQPGKEREALPHLRLASADVREAFLVSAQTRHRIGDEGGAAKDLEIYKRSAP